MKERPILFNSEMVRALLDGRKTMTRRVIKDYKIRRLSSRHEFATSGPHQLSLKETPGYAYVELESGSLVGLPCPYGQSGDLLWVKERIQRGYCGDMSMSRYMADGFPTVADAWPWKRDYLPSIHCPRGLSRITLEITDVRVERVQQISSHDAKQEGVSEGISPRAEFVALWDSINAARGFGWEVNPWVWCVEFRRIT